MFNKVHRKLTGMAAIVILVSLLLPAAGQSAMDALGGSLIQATPFDHKLMMAGGFETRFAGIVSGTSLPSSDGLFLQAHSIRYVADPVQQDHWQTPEETQARWAGDCEDKAVWLFAQLKKSGYSNVRLVVGRYRSLDKNYHVWVTMADDSGHILILDPTAQRRVWKNTDFGQEYYKALYSFDGFNRYRHTR